MNNRDDPLHAAVFILVDRIARSGDCICETVEKIYTKEVNRHAKVFPLNLLIISSESKRPLLPIPKNGTAFGLKFALLGKGGEMQ
jgi:hypothetical protein